MLKNVKKVHCIGIGGIGVSAQAEILLKRGYVVTGSDIVENSNTRRLEKLGAKIFIGHYAGVIDGADVVVHTSAVNNENPEYKAAKERGIPLLQRGDCLARLMSDKKAVAIVGSHGKTTTTSILAEIFLKAKLDPTISSGGILTVLNSPAHFGRGDYFIAEGDESDASFLYIDPFYAIVTNVDPDHLENYGDKFENLKETFIKFLNKIPAEGCAVLCIDDANVEALIPQLTCPYITYGFNPKADFCIQDFRQTDWPSEFVIKHSDQKDKITFDLPGKHNAQNAAAAFALAQKVGVDIKICQEALKHFKGVARRFQCHGDVKNTAVKLLEDYGHHPKEILETINAIRALWPEKKIQMVFQPHRYTRTKALFGDFVKVLQNVDGLYLIDIYEASEKPNGMTTAMLKDALLEQGFAKAEYISDRKQLSRKLIPLLSKNDVLVLQGAGDIGALRKDFLE